MKKRFLVFLLLWGIGQARVAFAADPKPQPGVTSSKPAQSESSKNNLLAQTIYDKKDSQVEVVADQLEYSRTKKMMIAQGNAVITYQNVKITSDYAEVDTTAKQAYARGHVFIFRGDQLATKGEQVYYDFANNTGRFPDARVLTEPWYAKGTKVDQVAKGVLKVEEGCVTSCYEEVPNYKIRAKSVTIYTGDKMIARNVTIYILEKPVFWLPYIVIPLNNKNAPINVTPGYSSRDGAYILSSVGYSINRHLGGKILADWRSKHGVGGGAVLGYDYGPLAQGQLVGYLTQDKRAPTPSAENPYSVTEDRTRGRLTWKHRSDFDENTHIIAKYHRASDARILQDFFRKEDHLENEQHSFIAATHNTEHYGLLFDAQKRMNKFESEVERLPELRADWRNQPFLRPGLFYQSQASFANLDNRYTNSPSHSHANRFDTFHEWSAPMKIDWQQLKFTPYVNARGTYYSRKGYSPDDVARLVAGFGADLRTQYYRTIPVTSDKLGIEINNLRHVLEPSVQLNSTHPTISGDAVTQFDPIDKIDSQDIVTLGLENRLQTKRMINGKMQRVDIVSLNTFLNYDTNTSELNNQPSGFASFTPELVLRPYQWLQYETRANYDVHNGELQVFNQDLLIRIARAKFLFGHRYVKDPSKVSSANLINTSNLVLFELGYQLNKIWKIGGYIRFDANKTNLEEWQISATRDLGCLWLLDFGYNVRSSAISSSNKEFFFDLRMKGFPQYVLRNGSKASFAEPRIGETVAGSNQHGGETSAESFSFY